MTVSLFRQQISQLRQLIFSGADTQIVLEFIDRFQLNFPCTDQLYKKYEQSRKQLAQSKHSLKLMGKENKTLRRCLQEAETQLQMKAMKVDKLLKDLEGHRWGNLREERKTAKKEKLMTHSVEIQCSLVTLSELDQTRQLYIQARNQNQVLRLQLQQFSQKDQDSEDSGSELSDGNSTSIEEYYDQMTPQGGGNEGETNQGEQEKGVAIQIKGNEVSSLAYGWNWLTAKCSQFCQILKINDF